MRTTASNTSAPRRPSSYDVPEILPVTAPAEYRVLERRIARLLDAIDQLDTDPDPDVRQQAEEKLCGLINDLQRQADQIYGAPYACPKCVGAETAMTWLKARRPVRGCVRHTLWIIRLTNRFD